MRAIVSIGKKANRIKKESPNEGTETAIHFHTYMLLILLIKKESPNEGTETRIISVSFDDVFQHIKKESPNKGTETPDH